MKANLIQIGNSRGIRIPTKIIETLRFNKEIEIEIIENYGLLIKPSDKVIRKDWDFAFKKMRENEDDTLLISENLTDEYMADIEW